MNSIGHLTSVLGYITASTTCDCLIVLQFEPNLRNMSVQKILFSSNILSYKRDTSRSDQVMSIFYRGKSYPYLHKSVLVVTKTPVIWTVKHAR